MIGDATLFHANQHNRAAIRIEPGIENEGLQGIFGATLRRRDTLHDGFQHVFHANAALCADEKRIIGRNRQDGFDLLLHEIGLGRGQVDFVDHRDDGEIVAGGKKSVGHSLCFHALAGIDD